MSEAAQEQVPAAPETEPDKKLPLQETIDELNGSTTSLSQNATVAECQNSQSSSEDASQSPEKPVKECNYVDEPMEETVPASTATQPEKEVTDDVSDLIKDIDDLTKAAEGMPKSHEESPMDMEEPGERSDTEQQSSKPKPDDESMEIGQSLSGGQPVTPVSDKRTSQEELIGKPDESRETEVSDSRNVDGDLDINMCEEGNTTASLSEISQKSSEKTEMDSAQNTVPDTEIKHCVQNEDATDLTTIEDNKFKNKESQIECKVNEKVENGKDDKHETTEAGCKVTVKNEYKMSNDDTHSTENIVGGNKSVEVKKEISDVEEKDEVGKSNQGKAMDDKERNESVNKSSPASAGPRSENGSTEEEKEPEYEIQTAEEDSPQTLEKESSGKDVEMKDEASRGSTEANKVEGSVTAKDELKERGRPKDSKAEIKTITEDGNKEEKKSGKSEKLLQPKGEAESVTKPEPKPAKPPQTCIVCKKVGKCKYNIVRNGDIKHLCDDHCFQVFRANPTNYLKQKGREGTPDVEQSPVPQSCTICNRSISDSNRGKYVLSVKGQYKFFCKESCQTTFKKTLKACAYCKKDIKGDAKAFVSPVTALGGTVIKDFCSQKCYVNFERREKGELPLHDEDAEGKGASKVTRYRTRSNAGKATCSVCGKMASVKHEITFSDKVHKLCGEPCFVAFCYSNKLSINVCANCGIHSNQVGNIQSAQFEGSLKKFCGHQCMNSFKQKNNKVISCAWCHTKKSNFDMIERVDANNKFHMFCTLNCLSLYRVNLQATSNQMVSCDQCRKMSPAQYHLTMSDASVRNFCSYNCVMAFQGQFNTGGTSVDKGQAQPAQQKATVNTAMQQQRNFVAAPNTTPPAPQPTRQSSRQVNKAAAAAAQQSSFPVISNVISLASQQQTPPSTRGKVRTAPQSNSTPAISGSTQTGSHQVIIQPPPPKQVKNKSLLCKPFTQTKATSCRPHTLSKETQTDEHMGKSVLIPVPIPIYVPVPMMMYNNPVPYPLPIPIPIPVPSFIPTTKKSAEGILRHIKEIQDKMPADPFEAELLMMAEAVASVEGEETSSDEEDNTDTKDFASVGSTTAAGANTSTVTAGDGNVATNDLGEDMLQMAIRMAQEMRDEPMMDLEDSLQPTPINPEDRPPQPQQQSSEFSTIDPSNDILTASRTDPPRPKRGRRGGRQGGGARRPQIRKPKIEEPQEVHTEPVTLPPQPPAPPPDADMVLKYTYGVNAWKHWVINKNSTLEKASSNRRLKLFKTDILGCTADELNFSLCLFVKEVRKPNGDEYAPDSIYYLCLGIQQYLFENGRIDNIFTDVYYEKFTEALNDILTKYEVRLNTQGLIVCRIEEEHLWESKQLGAHSPHVLLNTLVYFNTKYFMLRTPEEHLKLSFSHIMKHWKKTNIPGSKTPGRSVYLRYYSPAANTGNDPPGSKRKREESPVYEQAENVENPLRCPVKLYEFYLSKCPESIRNRNDVFYLVPEFSCVPDSPVWYSAANLGEDSMRRRLKRHMVVREIQEALLHHSQQYY